MGASHRAAASSFSSLACTSQYAGHEQRVLAHEPERVRFLAACVPTPAAAPPPMKPREARAFCGDARSTRSLITSLDSRLRDRPEGFKRRVPLASSTASCFYLPLHYPYPSTGKMHRDTTQYSTAGQIHQSDQSRTRNVDKRGFRLRSNRVSAARQCFRCQYLLTSSQMNPE
jgi:hypothetical protein